MTLFVGGNCEGSFFTTSTWSTTRRVVTHDLTADRVAAFFGQTSPIVNCTSFVKKNERLV